MVLWKKQTVDPNKLAKLYWDQGLTQTEIARRCKIRRATVSDAQLSGLNRFYWIRGPIVGAIKFVSFVVRLGLGLALIGQLKFCTFAMMGKAAEKSQKEVMDDQLFKTRGLVTSCKKTL